MDAVDQSFERLGTHIDVLQIHRLDRQTPREETMKALHYIGASPISFSYLIDRETSKASGPLLLLDGCLEVSGIVKYSRQAQWA